MDYFWVFFFEKSPGKLKGIQLSYEDYYRGINFIVFQYQKNKIQMSIGMFY